MDKIHHSQNPKSEMASWFSPFFYGNINFYECHFRQDSG
jgi:hypothetical protein